MGAKALRDRTTTPANAAKTGWEPDSLR